MQQKLEQGVPRGEAYNHRLKDPTGEPVLDLLGCVLADAFAAAEEGDSAARQFLRETLSAHALAQLRARNLISW